MRGRRGLLAPLWTTALARLREHRSVILGYHGVGSSSVIDDMSMLLVSPSRFRRQIELLVDAGFRFLTVAELAREAAGKAPPPGYAAISFDDGMRNNYTTALPILSSYGIAATIYVTIGFIGGVSPWVRAAGENRMLNEAEIGELASAGWELGAHTMTHPDLSTLDYATCLEEIQNSRTELERISGAQVETFAYPSGLYGPAAIAAVADSGLRAAVTTGSGSWASYELTRAMIGSRDPMGVVLLKLADRYEPLLRTPPLHQVRRASKQLRGHMQRGEE
jgi:peptidoglycan/xylan/chitin deacetylase (PgdA/CDA1 family)